MECCTCSSFYHGLCVGISPPELDKLSSDTKTGWLCPECRNKRPRSDNTNTPVRPSTPPCGAYGDANVTLRRGKQGPSKQQAAHAPAPVGCTDECVSRSELREIIREEFRSFMKECVREIKGDLNRELKAFRNEIGSLKDSINFIGDSFDKMNTEIATCKSKIEDVLKENESLRNDLNVITNRFNQLEQLSRASSLEIQCVPERKSENLVSIVKQLGKTVSCPVNEADIFYCARIAKKNPESPRARSILIKLNSPKSRDALLAATIKYNKSHPQDRLSTVHLGLGSDKKVAVYVTENLSPENKFLHASARARAKELQYKHVWVRGGRIYMRKTDTSEYVLVRNLSTLKQLS